jgi:hypothetical protein
MKTRLYLSTLAILLVIGGCKKKVDPVTVPVDFSATSYQTLGTYDQSGRPNYLAGKDVISTDLLSYINTTLPDKKDLRLSRPELLSSQANADIAITQSSDVFITFVHQVTGKSDAIAFYTYPSNQPPTNPKDIKTITYIFPNAGAASTLEAGDKVKIGRFNPGTSIGFVLLSGAWSIFTKSLNNNVEHFCSNDILNPEVDPSLKKHAVLIDYPSEKKVLIGFEDVNRTNPGCDHDFNDVMLYATVTP